MAEPSNHTVVGIRGKGRDTARQKCMSQEKGPDTVNPLFSQLLWACMPLTANKREIVVADTAVLNASFIFDFLHKYLILFQPFLLCAFEELLPSARVAGLNFGNISSIVVIRRSLVSR